jgi:hypothetical protein
VTTAVCVELTETAEPVNVADDDPAGTDTEAGTLRAALLSDTATDIPLDGAPALRLTVQVRVPGVVNVVGVHARELNVAAVRELWMLMLPPVAVRVAPTPAGSAAMALETPIETEEPLTLVASLTLTVATTPLPMVLVLTPAAMHLMIPEPELQVTALPAAEAADPVDTATLATLLVG